MKHKRFNAIHMTCAALSGALAAALLMGLLLGRHGLSLVVAWEAVRTSFVGEYDPDEAVDAALTGLVWGLGDRWSYYLNAEENKAQTERRRNDYVGVGITVGCGDSRGLTLLAVQPGTPADRAGLKAGEIITAVDGLSAAGEGQAGCMEAIQGRAGVSVSLTVLSPDGGSREVEVVRAAVERQSVRGELLENGVGYIAVENFYTHSAQQLSAAVDELVEQGASALVFDMRNNGGGYVEQLTQMLDYLLPQGPVFRSQDALGWEEVARSDEKHIDLPMATLVNENTYSAAEFFAAQLQETAGAVIVGTETSGKGYSQQPVYLPNGGALNLSTGKYTTGAGKSLVGSGVRLDAEVPVSGEESEALAAGTLSHSGDSQLQKALELLG